MVETAPVRSGPPDADRPPVRAVAQVAYAVPDLVDAARDWARSTGAGPFFVRHHLAAAAVDAEGHAAVFHHSSAYGQWGNVQVELVQVHATTSASLAGVVPVASGLHHVAWFVPDLHAEQLRLTALGWPALMTASTASGQRFAFHDARQDLGHLVEIYEPSCRVRELYAHVARAGRDWDGRAPVRALTGLSPGTDLTGERSP